MAQYDIAILGGGPGGYVAAIKAAQLGAKTALIERGALGGVCLNEGCIPTKTLLKSAKVYQELAHATKYGISLSGDTKVSIDWAAMLRRKDNVVDQLTRGVKRLLEGNGVQVYQGYGEVKDPTTLDVNGERISTKHLIIATGSSPTIIPIPGLKESLSSGLALTSPDVLALPEVPKELVIVGGGVIGIEFAALFNALGTAVTVLEKYSILNGLDHDVQSYMLKTLRKKGIEIHDQVEVEKFDGASVVAQVEGQRKTFRGEYVVVSLGRTPNLQAVQNLNLTMDGSGIRTNERLETNIPGVYGVGDVNGKYMLAHVASAEGIIAVENIMGKKASINYEKVPSCIYSFPEVGVVGLSEKEAIRRGHQVKMGTFPMAANGKALAEGETEGFVKIVADAQYGEVLGVHIIAAHATDLIAEAVTTLELEGTIYDLAKTIHPHPSLSEVVMEAAYSAFGQPIHQIRNKE